MSACFEMAIGASHTGHLPMGVQMDDGDGDPLFAAIRYLSILPRR